MIDVDAAPTGYRETSEAGPVAVLLHGLGGTRTAWRPQFEGLSQHRRLIAWDAPGYGVSDRISEPTFTAWAQAAEDLIERVSPGKPVDLVGMSFGGMIAQNVAARRPDLVRSLTLLCTSPKFGLDGTDPDEWRARRLAGLEEFGSPGAAAPVILASLAGPNAQHVVPEAVEAMQRVRMEGLMDALTTITSHDTRAILPTITAPTLVVVGADDDETPPSYAQAIADLIPGARLVVIPGAGHLLNLEAPEALNAAIADHWEQS